MANDDKPALESVVSEKRDSTTHTTLSDEDSYNIPLQEAIPPGEHDVVVDPRLKGYPVPLVAKTVSLENDPT